VEMLLAEGQEHLFAGWPAAGEWAGRGGPSTQQSTHAPVPGRAVRVCVNAQATLPAWSAPPQQSVACMHCTALLLSGMHRAQ
jgi:hypothetical protein